MTLRARTAVIFTIASAVLSLFASAVLWWPPALFAAEPAAAAPALTAEAYGMGFLAAALATGLSALGAAIAVANVGAAAVGAITEKPEMLGRVLILVGLAEGIAIYGLIISILILNRLL
jgi:V/A-type H+-transporting ATPase subunit K